MVQPHFERAVFEPFAFVLVGQMMAYEEQGNLFIIFLDLAQDFRVLRTCVKDDHGGFLLPHTLHCSLCAVFQRHLVGFAQHSDQCRAGVSPRID